MASFYTLYWPFLWTFAFCLKLIALIFNYKSLPKTIGDYLGIQKRGYCDFVLRKIRGSKSEEIINALRNYLPNEIPMKA